MTNQISSANDWAKKGQDLIVAEQKVIDLQLPSGAVVKAIRPDLESFFLLGLSPSTLTDAASRAHRHVSATELTRDIAEDPVKTERMLVAMRELVLQAVIQPRIVIGAQPGNPNEIEAIRVPKDDWKFLMVWIGRGCPGVPVETQKGEVGLDEVQTFPRKRSGAKAGKRVRAVSRKTKR